MDCQTLADRLDLHERGVRDFLDALVALGMVERQSGHYFNMPEPACFWTGRKPTYIGGLLEMANSRLYAFWGSLTEALRTGKPQNEAARGRDLFQELYSDPARLRQFLTAMTGISVPTARAIAAHFPWNAYRSFGGHRLRPGLANAGCTGPSSSRRGGLRPAAGRSDL